jgi:hypothetical protein|tara:strand:+ start:15478 stop:15747 length:270 start_codon:yes stop_codon:yes gene_type:complete
MRDDRFLQVAIIKPFISLIDIRHRLPWILKRSLIILKKILIMTSLCRKKKTTVKEKTTRLGVLLAAESGLQRFHIYPSSGFRQRLLNGF